MPGGRPVRRMLEPSLLPIRAPATPEDHMQTTYGRPQIEFVLGKGRWEDWDEVLHWLEDEGPDEPRLATSTVRSMTEDFRALQQGGEAFSNDSGRIYKLVRWMWETSRGVG